MFHMEKSGVKKTIFKMNEINFLMLQGKKKKENIRQGASRKLNEGYIFKYKEPTNVEKKE
jgi:hypothetical protein